MSASFQCAGRTWVIVMALLWSAPLVARSQSSDISNSASPIISVSPDSLVDSLFTGGHSTQTISISNQGTTDLNFDIALELIDESRSVMSVDQAVASMAARSALAVGQEAIGSAVVHAEGQPVGDEQWPARLAYTSQSAGAPNAFPHVALLAADYLTFATDVQNHLLATGRFGSVSVIDVSRVTPTLSELQSFDALLVWSNFYLANSVALGDALADYVDGGGGVVCAMFELYNASGYSLGGRWASERYELIEPGGFRTGGNRSLGTVTVPAHPTVANVRSFEGGGGSFRPNSPSLTAGSTRIASWSDGSPLVVVKSIGAARRVDLGFFPPSSRVYAAFWNAVTDGDLLLANALEWTARAWIAFAPQAGTIAPGTDSEVSIRFDASGLSGGDYRANVLISSDDPLVPVVTVPTHLNVTGAPHVKVSDSILDFGTTYTGTSHVDTCLVYNGGTELLVVNLISAIPTDFSVDPSSFSVNPGAFQSVIVWFAPSTTGMINGTLTISTNDPDEPVAVVSLTGTGLDPPVIVVSPDSVMDSLLTGETSEHGLTIANSGLSDLRFNITCEQIDPPALLTVEEAVASLASRGGSQPALERAPRTSVVQAPPLDMESSPRGTVARMARASTRPPAALHVALLAADDPTFASDVQDHLLSSGRFESVSVIDASATTPELAELLAFDAVLVWSNNSFNQPVTLGDRLADYVDAGRGVVCAMFELYGDPFISLGGRWESDRYYLIERSGNRCCDNLSLGAVADPSHPIMDNVASFEGGYASYRPGGEVLTTGSTLVASWSDGTPLVVSRNMPTSRRVDLGFFPPSSRVGGSDFWDADTDGDQLLANAMEWVSRSWIDVEPDSGVVPAGGQLDLVLQFDAARLFGGDLQANVRIASNDPFTPEVVVPALLHVTGVPDISVVPTMLDFGNTFTGTSATDTLILRNLGTDVLSVGAISVDATEFLVSTGGFSLTPGALHKLAVSFAPSATGVFKGSLSISSDDPDEPTVDVSLMGIGLDPPVISVSPDSLADSLDFGEASSHTLTIANHGASDLTFDIRFDGTALPEATLDTGPDVALLAADAPENVADVRQHLLGTGAFDSITWIDVRSVVPGLLELQSFDAVLVWSNSSFADRDALGDTLAAYVDAGGGVVSALFETAGSPFLGGRWEADRYYIMDRSGTRSGHASLGAVSDPSHPIMAGVSTFDGGPASYRPNTANLAAGATLVASWSDGMPLAATKLIGPARRVELGFFLPSNNVYADFWQTETDGALLLANALSWVAVPWLSADSASGTIAAGDALEVSLTFDASLVYGGDYAANIGVHSNDPVTPEVLVPARMQVTGTPDIAVSNTQIDFGLRFLGSETPDTLVLYNEGTDVLNVSLGVTGTTAIAVDPIAFDVPPKGARPAVVTYSPGVTGELNGVLTVSSNDPDEPEVLVVLAGSAALPPVIQVPDEPLMDSLFVGETSTSVLTVANTGASDLQFEISFAPVAPPAGLMTQAAPEGPRVAVVAAAQDNYLTDVRNLLAATGRFASVETIDARVQLPSLKELQRFDALLVWNDGNYTYLNSTELGNRLADYVDAGGGVVCALYESVNSNFLNLHGRWETDRYYVLAKTGSRYGNFASLGTRALPRHPILTGVKTFEGGSGSFRPASAVLNTGCVLVASWSDGMPLVATRQMPAARRVDLGMFPPSSQARFDGWAVTSDGDVLMANALAWAARSWVDVQPHEGTVAPGQEIQLAVSFDASWLDPGDYGTLLLILSDDPVLPEVALGTHLYALPAVPGDCNGDGVVNGRDVILLVNYVFRNGSSPRGQSGDFNCEFAVTVVDVITLVNFVFKGVALETCP